jgi:hypothetical protein
MQRKKFIVLRRRKIHVGDQVAIGSICDICETAPAIYPESTMDKHLRRHIVVRDLLKAEAANYSRYRGGQPPGSKNKNGSMSSTGVERKISIRNR